VGVAVEVAVDVAVSVTVGVAVDVVVAVGVAVGVAVDVAVAVYVGIGVWVTVGDFVGRGGDGVAVGGCDDRVGVGSTVSPIGGSSSTRVGSKTQPLNKIAVTTSRQKRRCPELVEGEPVLHSRRVNLYLLCDCTKVLLDFLHALKLLQGASPPVCIKLRRQLAEKRLLAQPRRGMKCHGYGAATP
jgi:hypothetical protein